MPAPWHGASPPIRSTPKTLEHSGGPGGPSGTDGLLQRPGAADGKLSENFSPLENEWDRQDQLRWFSRDDLPPLQAGASVGLWRRGPVTIAWVPPAPARRRPRARTDTRCWTRSSWGSPGSRWGAVLASMTFNMFTPKTSSTPATRWN